MGSNMDKDMNQNEEMDMEEEDAIFTLTDEEGNESQFALVGQMEVDGQEYLALIPADTEGGDEEDEYVILRVTEDENGEEILVTIDDEDEFDRVADACEDRFMSEYDLDDSGDGE